MRKSALSNIKVCYRHSNQSSVVWVYQEIHGRSGRTNPVLFGNLIHDTVGITDQQEGMECLLCCSRTTGQPSETESLP